MATDQLSLAFSALADPTRRAIVARLATGDATVNELAAPFDISLQAISKHVQVLEHAGLVSKGRDAQARPCHLEADRLEPLLDWVTTQHGLWSDRLGRLDAYLRLVQSAATRPEALHEPLHDLSHDPADDVGTDQETPT
jgi:DNA-binding transcriptional ArsR family regulator